jgi:RND family efflux transporter MFP subunit
MMTTPTRFSASIYVNKRSFIYTGTALAVVGIAAIAMADPDESGVVAVPRHVLAAPVVADTGEAVALTGVVQPALPTEASAAGAGRITRLLADVGEAVAAGQALAMIDDVPARARLQQADAELARARAQASERAAALARATFMADGGATAPAERDAAKADATAARAAVAAAEAQRAVAAHEVAQGVIRAPAAGIIAERLVALGSVVAPGQKAFALEANGDRIILAAAPQRLASQLQRGQAVRFLSDGRPGQGVIVAVSPRVADGGVVPVKVAIRAGAPLAGSVVQLQLSMSPSGSSDTLRVPASAIMLDRNRTHFLYRITPANRAETVTVRLIGLAGNYARVSAPLLPGQRVVAAGGAFVTNGQALAIAQPGI